MANYIRVGNAEEKHLSQDLGLRPLRLPKAVGMFAVGSCFPVISGFEGFSHSLFYLALFWYSENSSPELQFLFLSIIPM